MDAAKFRCLEVSVMNVSIGMTSMIRCWLGAPVQVVYLGVKARVPKGSVSPIQQFFIWKANLQPLFASKTFCEFHFLCRCYLVLVQFGWNSSTKQICQLSWWTESWNLDRLRMLCLELISTSLHQLFVMPASASFGWERLDAMEVDPSTDTPTLKEACHDIHGIGHYVDKYIQKICCKRRLWDIVLLCTRANIRDCCQCCKPRREEFYSVD